MNATTHSYGAYGEQAGTAGHSRSRYAGEAPEADIGCYLLGARLYSPTLRRFLGPDALSPFDQGGVNRYAYCSGDPVNRIDPGGASWQAWIRDSFGLSRSTLPAAHGKGAAAPSDGLGTNAQAMVSPAAVTSVSSALMDLASPLATMASVATATQGAERAGGLFGWMSSASGKGSGALTPLVKATSATNESTGSDGARGVQTKLKEGYTKTTYTSSDGALRVDNYDGILGIHRKAPERLRGGFHAEWKGIPNANGGINYVADGPIWTNDVRRLMKLIKKSGSKKPITNLSGAHGGRLGNNWKNGQRRGIDARFYQKDKSSEGEYASLTGRPGRSITTVDLATITDTEFADFTDSNAIIVHAYCYGVADQQFMRRHNIVRATTYRV
jgi:RHS repeat-associated protein